jgi:arylsulfatase A-like enzyme
LYGIVNHQDMLPTVLAAAGDRDVTEKLKSGYKVGDKAFRVCIDGFNVLPYLTGEVNESPRNHFFYVSDDGGIMALRIGDYKLAFQLQESVSTNLWADPFTKLRLPHIFNLRRDPFERADFNSNVYWDWLIDHVPYLYMAQAVVQAQLDNFVKYPPRQKAASFNLDSVMAQLRPAMEAEKAKEAKEAQKEKRAA